MILHARSRPLLPEGAPQHPQQAKTPEVGSGTPLDRRPLARPRDVTREVRPDWDLSAPGLREVWNAGDLSHFHGWSKRSSPRARRHVARSSIATPERGHRWSSRILTPTTRPAQRLQPSRAAVDAGVPPGRHGGTATRRRWHDTGSTPRRAVDRRDLHRPRASGNLVSGASADWQIVLPDGTALGDIRYTLQTDDGDLLLVRSPGCATALPTSSPVSGAARTSTPASTRSAPPPRSRPQPRASTG